MDKQLKNISKLMSLVLRHQPEYLGITLNEHGWSNVRELIEKINSKGIVADFQTIETIVEINDKKRFAFNEDKTMIRASQGHSIEVALDLQQAIPPDILYHGTAMNNIESILKNGLQKQARQHVHLSKDTETAKAVGSRHGKPAILQVDAKAMHEFGFLFFISANHVWLTEAIPAEFISLL